MPQLMAWKTVEKLNPGVERTPRRRLTVGLGGKAKGMVQIARVLLVLEEEEAGYFGVELDDFPVQPAPVKIKLEMS